jgi:hypothetical protein
MATKRPSFLKRQKEQKRNARALEKREVRNSRREAKATQGDPSRAPDGIEEVIAPDEDMDGFLKP